VFPDPDGGDDTVGVERRGRSERRDGRVQRRGRLDGGGGCWSGFERREADVLSGR
jgi:hypothetical protein